MYTAVWLFIKHFMLPAFLLMVLWRSELKSKFNWLGLSIFTGIYVVLVYLTGQWYIYGFWSKYVLLLSFASVVVLSFWRVKDKPVWVRKDSVEWVLTAFTAMVSLVFVLPLMWAIYGLNHPGDALALDLPLKTGTYYVREGGNAYSLSVYNRFPEVPYKYSVDFVKINGWGMQASSLFPDSLADFEIWDERVYSPCDGIVIGVQDSLPDLPVADADTSEATFLGNRITIAVNEVQVALTHLRQHSLQVSPGDTVHVGQYVARVGASGSTAVPVLHIYAFRERESSPWGGEGIPLHFQQRFLVRNDRVSGMR